MSISDDITARMQRMADEAEARHLMRFFKTAPGQYGEGDRFLGVRVPLTRALAQEYKRRVELSDIQPLLDSEYHELRLAGFFLLIEIYNRLKKRRDFRGLRMVVDYYLSVIDRGNNWDLVDMVAPKILGDWLTFNPDEIPLLDQLAAMDGRLWHQRVGVVANWRLIRAGIYDPTLRIAQTLLTHPHDLIHKATGWMLREVGKHGGLPKLLAFLDLHTPRMPRTMLRYAIEQLPAPQRTHYLTLPRK